MSDSSKPSATSSGSTPSLFGSASGANTTSQTTSIFGQPSSQAPSSSGTSLFGNTQTPGFGGASSSPTFGVQSSQTRLFNTDTASGSAGGGFTFGTKPTSDGKQENKTNLFGGLTTPNKNSSVSGSNQSQTSTLFGASTGNTTGLSSAATPTNDKPAFSFGNVSTTPAGPPPASTGSSLFSLGQSTGNPSSAFGSATSTAPAQQPAATAASSNLFGQKTQTTTSTQAPTSLFGSSSSQPTGSNLFGNPSQSTQSSQPQQSGQGKVSSLFQNPQTSNNATVSKPQETPTAKPLFGFSPSISNSQQNKSDPGTSSSAPTTSNLFANINAKPDDKASQQQNQTTTASLTTSNATATSSATPSIFSSGTKPSSDNNTAPASAPLFGTSKPASSSASANIETSAAKTSTASNVAPGCTTDLGSSTSGPAPTTQSRLKNKSMDDIITRWSTDLSKYQKEFQKQADKVMEWDRTLLNNGNAISQIYSRTLQAERDTAEVERQLNVVEGHQNELSHWLDRYEKEVDELTAKHSGPESHQGPDQERERTFKTAERISERLNEMGRDLTGMIDEINEASAAISKTNKPNDPLSQIVRILNGHLLQLQQIDQGTVELQKKVDVARKELNSFSGLRSGANNDAVDDFYNSYLRRG